MTVVETPLFLRKAEKVLDEDERAVLVPRSAKNQRPVRSFREPAGFGSFVGRSKVGASGAGLASFTTFTASECPWCC